MNIKHSIGLNLSADAIPGRLHMVQGDANSRTIVATLWDGAQPYSIPAEAAIMVRFRKPDGTGGLYDTTESGNKVSYTGSIVTAPVATQMLAVAGDVFAEIDIFGSSSGAASERLATFRFVVEVSPCVLPDADVISSDYYNILTTKVAEAVAAANQAKQAQSAAAASAAAAATSAASAATSVEGAVKYNAPQTLTDAQKKQARDNIGAPTPCNPNLLDNWYFPNPVNQRGQTSYTRGSADRYGIDCWKMMTATPNVITICGGYLELSQNALIGQLLEDPYKLCDKQVTASTLTTAGLFSFSAVVPSKAELSAITEDLSIGSANITVPGDTPGYIGLMHTKGHNTMLRLRAYEGHTINFIAAKLELGGVQTLAHQDADGNWVLNEIPSYAEQVSRCQRYLIPLSSYQCPAARLGTNEILFFVPLPVTMRALPTIKQNGFQVLSKSGAAQTGFTFSVSSLRSNGVIINAAKTGHKMTDAVLSAGTLSLLSAEL